MINSGLIVVVLVVFGLGLGSMVNALVWRLREQARLKAKKRPSKDDRQLLARLSMTRGRSMCPHCHHQLSSVDLVPVVSWVLLGGKCRYCRAKIPDTPLAELLVPLIFVLSYIFWPWQLEGVLAWLTLLTWLLIAVIAVALLIYDLRWFILPDRLVVGLVALAVIFRILLATQSNSPISTLLGGLWGVLVLAGLFAALFVASDGRWLGGGDVKIAVGLGLIVGGPLMAVLLLFSACLAGSLAAIPMLARRQSIHGAKVPFGPFLILATVFTLLAGQSIINWYLGFLTGVN